MTANASTSSRIVATPGDLGDHLARFRRSVRAENVSPNTVIAYVGAVERLAEYLTAQGTPTDVATSAASMSRPPSRLSEAPAPRWRAQSRVPPTWPEQR
jgi:hypothetical protein